MVLGKIGLIEGTDASGKQTQTEKLVERLNSEGIITKTLSFPTYRTPTGRIVGQCYLGKNPLEYGWEGDVGWFGDPDKLDPKIASLYYAGNRVAEQPFIAEVIEAGENLILDRYAQSNMAHQGGKLLTRQERENLFVWLEKLEFELLGIRREDFALFLHMPTNVAMALRNQRGEKTGEIADGHESNLGHLLRAEETYLQLSEYFNWKTISCAPDGTIASLRSIDDIHEEIYNYARPFFTGS